MPSGSGSLPSGEIPKLELVNTFSVLTTNGRFTIPKLGTFISIDGDVTFGGVVGYVEASATAIVSVLYVGTTRISKFRVGMGVINKMPEDFEN
jgi:hypothetical protein